MHLFSFISMNHPFGPNGPYFSRSCQRDRFPSLTDEIGIKADRLVSALGSAAIADMNSRLKRGHRSTYEAERRAAQAALDANVPPARIYLRSTPQGFRRAVDIFMPRFSRDENMSFSEEEERSEDHAKTQSIAQKQRIRRGLAAPRQTDEPPYTGNCHHCRELGSDDMKSDERGRGMARRVFHNMDLFTSCS
ncbi:uncharacterized protein LOC108113421 isoform X2 [Drosophila eugracilis]|uniref:uncharacterized protein LOC108113421 isoform X2 n=1 Tax=Drosophila eugracilis TaxID=29029 RepID=UPI0007E6AEF1|nr:uncharacterized protein LOC108113421 isoform X2 [Drosophila eugracilis]